MRRAALPLVLLPLVSFAVAEDGDNTGVAFGTLSGRITFEGAIPEAVPLIDAAGRGRGGRVNPKAAGLGAIPDERLVVDAESRGIANVFVYLRKAPAVIHPDRRTVPEKPFTVTIEGARYRPHAFFTRAGRTVVFDVKDQRAYNPHVFPIKNTVPGFLLPPGGRVEFRFPQAEILPVQVKDDIHPWMSANWLNLDHPYAAITKPNGEFTIPDLPEGKHSFRVWHERAGYLNRALEVTIGRGETTKSTLVYDVTDFE